MQLCKMHPLSVCSCSWTGLPGPQHCNTGLTYPHTNIPINVARNIASHTTNEQRMVQLHVTSSFGACLQLHVTCPSSLTPGLPPLPTTPTSTPSSLRKRPAATRAWALQSATPTSPWSWVASTQAQLVKSLCWRTSATAPARFALVQSARVQCVTAWRRLGCCLLEVSALPCGQTTYCTF